MPGFVSDSIREQIRAANDIVEVIGGYVPLKKSGGAFVALCPFHKEKSPSFHVNPHKQFFHCFGCHKGGDVFGFVQEYEHITFPEALRRLAERAHIPIEFESQPGQEKARFLKETLFAIHEQLTQRWQGALVSESSGSIAREYLQTRGVSDEAVKLFRLGFAPDQWDDTVNWARGKGFELAVMEQAGLIVRKEEPGQYYDRFRGRLMFPICDEQGRVIAFSGRVLRPDQSPAKYVNSPETPLFTKGRVIFGLDKSKREILEKKSVVVCEGQLDLISCYMAGVRHIVAPQGTAFTAEQVRILRRYAEEVILCFDSDAAGQNAALRSLDSLLGAGMAIRVALVPAPHDPDSYIKAFGSAAFEKIIGDACGFFDFYLDYLCQRNPPTTDRGRLAIVTGMRENLAKTQNSVLADTYAQKTAMRIGVAVDSVRAEFKKIANPAPERTEPEDYAEEETGVQVPRPPDQEAWFLKLLLTNEEQLDWIACRLQLDWLSDPLVRELVGQRLRMHSEGSWPGFAGWLGQFESASVRNFLTEAASESRPIKDIDQVIKGTRFRAGILQILRDKFIDRRLAEVTRRLTEPGVAETEQVVLLQEKNELRQEKARIVE